MSDPDLAEAAQRTTVRDVLGLKVMAGSQILAGQDGLDRVVSGVNIIEVPDVHRWLKGGSSSLRRRSHGVMTPTASPTSSETKGEGNGRPSCKR